MSHPPEAQLSRIAVGDHLCLLYDQPTEALSLAARFLRQGLDRGEHGFYVVDDHDLADVVAALRAEGVDVEAEREAGRLRFLDAREYCPLESFEPQAMLERFRALGDELAAAGIPAARAAVEMTWALSVGAPLDLLAEYECLGNHIFEHFTGMSLCMYNRRRFPPEAMERLLRAHPIVALDGDVAPNPFYEPPELVFGASDAAGARFEHMLLRLRESAADRRVREELAAEQLRERQAREAAEEMHARKSRLLAEMGHELRTPLNAIIGYQDLLDQEVAGPLNAEQRGHLRRIDRSARHLLGVIDELLEMARVEAGHEEIRRERVDARAVVQEVVELVAPEVSRQALDLRVELPEGPLPLLTDEGKLRQILLNLASNAVKYTRQGFVELSLRREEGGEVVFEVSDSGIGMDTDDVERAFQPFTQVHEERHDRGGSGLGLSVSRGLASFLGATLSARSVPGVGSAFTLRFPGEPLYAAPSASPPDGSLAAD